MVKTVLQKIYMRARIIYNQSNFYKDNQVIKEILNFHNHPNSFIKRWFNKIEYLQAKQNQNKHIANFFIS